MRRGWHSRNGPLVAGNGLSSHYAPPMGLATLKAAEDVFSTAIGSRSLATDPHARDADAGGFA